MISRLQTSRLGRYMAPKSTWRVHYPCAQNESFSSRLGTSTQHVGGVGWLRNVGCHSCLLSALLLGSIISPNDRGSCGSDWEHTSAHTLSPSPTSHLTAACTTLQVYTPMQAFQQPVDTAIGENAAVSRAASGRPVDMAPNMAPDWAPVMVPSRAPAPAPMRAPAPAPHRAPAPAPRGSGPFARLPNPFSSDAAKLIWTAG